jgi:hypothetical protein
MHKLPLVILTLVVLNLTGCGGDSEAPDTTPPIITLAPSNTLYELVIGDDVPAIEVMATDDRDGDISNQVVISGDTIKNDAPGTYIQHYDVSDSSGNNAKSISVTYVYQMPPDTVAPLIVIAPEISTYELVVGDEIPLVTVTAVDDIDGDISSQVIISGDVINSDAPGTYVRHYDVTDSAGNSANRVSITFNVSNAPIVYQLSFDGVPVQNGIIELIEAAAVEVVLDSVETHPMGPQYWSRMTVTEVSGEDIDFAPWRRGTGKGQEFIVVDEEQQLLGGLFEGVVVAQMPHVHQDSTTTLEVNFTNQNEEIVYTDYITVLITDQAIEIPESGMYSEQFSEITTDTIIALETIQPSYAGSNEFTIVYGVALDENLNALSFVNDISDSSWISASIDEPQLSGFTPDDFILKDGISINRVNGDIIVPQVKVEYGEAAEIEVAQVIKEPSGTCNYYNEVLMTSQGSVDSEGRLIHAMSGLCDLVILRDTGNRKEKTNQSTTVLRYNDVTKSVEVLDIETDGMITILNSVPLEQSPEDNLVLTLFNESGLVFQDSSDPERYVIYTFPANRNSYLPNEPRLEQPIVYRSDEITDILVMNTPFDEALLIAEPNKPYVTLLRSIRTDDMLKEKITVADNISWLSYGEAPSDFDNLNFIIFSGKGTGTIYTRRDKFNDSYD